MFLVIASHLFWSSKTLYSAYNCLEIFSCSVVSNERSINRGEKNAKNEVPKEFLCDIDDTENVEKRDGVVERKDQLGSNNEPFTFCCRNDGKGWRCKKRARDGHCLCKHHLAQLKMYKKIGSFY